MYGLSAGTTYITITFVGGLPFLVAAIVLLTMYYSGRLSPQFCESAEF